MTFSRRSRISSIPRLEAASISNTSILLPSLIRWQLAHSLQGLAVGPCSQFRAFARIFAVLVLPVPLGPANKYACAIRPVVKALLNAILTAS